MIEFRQCSLRLFRFCDWSSLFSDNSPCASFWTTQNFIPNGVGTSAMKFVQSGQRRQNASDFGVWREGCSFPTAFDHNWNQYKTDRNLGTKSQRGGNWQQCCGGISFELRVFAQESNFLGLEFVCLFFVSQKCRHWILVEDYGMHVYIQLHTTYLFICIFVMETYKETHTVYFHMFTDFWGCPTRKSSVSHFYLSRAACNLALATAGRRMVQTGATCRAASRVVFVKAWNIIEHCRDKTPNKTLCLGKKRCLIYSPLFGWCHWGGFGLVSW